MKRILIIMVLIFCFCGVAIAEDVELAWDANSDPITGYGVYRAVTSGGYTFGGGEVGVGGLIAIIPCAMNDTYCAGYWNMGLPPGATYYWVVTAFNGNGYEYESGPSNEVTHTTVPTDPTPNDPTGCFVRSVAP